MGNLYPHQPIHPPILRLKPPLLLNLVLGLAALLTAAILPVRFQAIDERLLIAAGQGTTPLTELAASLLNSEHLGAGLRLALLAQSMHLPESDAVLHSAHTLLSSRPDLASLGTRRPPSRRCPLDQPRRPPPPPTSPRHSTLEPPLHRYRLRPRLRPTPRLPPRPHSFQFRSTPQLLDPRPSSL